MFEVNDVSNVVVNFDISTSRSMVVFFNGTAIRWNEYLGIFENCDAGTNFVTNMLKESGIQGYSQDAHIDIESLPTTSDIGYRVVSG